MAFPKIMVFDTEIVNSIGKEFGIGWKDYDKMHVSVAVAFCYWTGDYHIFCEDNMQGLINLLEEADLVAAFNNKGFDNPLIAAEARRLNLTCRQCAVSSFVPDGVGGDYDMFLTELNAKSYDMLEESRKGWGWVEGKRYPVGFKLDEHLNAIWGADMAKTDDGALAPVKWRSAKIGEVISYCVADVRRERQLFEWAWFGGEFRCAGSRGHQVRRPQEVLGVATDTRLPYFGGRFSDKAVATIAGNFKEPID